MVRELVPKLERGGLVARRRGFRRFAKGVLLLSALALLCVPAFAISENLREAGFEERRFRDGEEFLYRFAWAGIPAATASIKLREESASSGSKMHIEVKARSLKWLSLLWNMSAKGRASFFTETMRPDQYSFVYEENRRKTETVTTFDDANNVALVRRTKRGKTKEVRFEARNAYDPFTFTMVLRSLQLVPGGEAEMHVINGTDEYLIKTKVLEREQVRVKAGKFDAFKLEPAVLKLGDEDEEKQKLKKMHMWLSADDRQLLLKLEIAATVGSITCELVSESGS